MSKSVVITNGESTSEMVVDSNATPEVAIDAQEVEIVEEKKRTRDTSETDASKALALLLDARGIAYTRKNDGKGNQFYLTGSKLVLTAKLADETSKVSASYSSEEKYASMLAYVSMLQFPLSTQAYTSSAKVNTAIAVPYSAFAKGEFALIQAEVLQNITAKALGV